MSSKKPLSSRPPEPTAPAGPGSKVPATAKVHGKDRDMGAALRGVYQRTVDEAIPDDLLDLLGKLN